MSDNPWNEYQRWLKQCYGVNLSSDKERVLEVYSKGYREQAQAVKELAGQHKDDFESFYAAFTTQFLADSPTPDQPRTPNAADQPDAQEARQAFEEVEFETFKNKVCGLVNMQWSDEDLRAMFATFESDFTTAVATDADYVVLCGQHILAQRAAAQDAQDGQAMEARVNAQLHKAQHHSTLQDALNVSAWDISDWAQTPTNLCRCGEKAYSSKKKLLERVPESTGIYLLQACPPDADPKAEASWLNMYLGKAEQAGGLKAHVDKCLKGKEGFIELPDSGTDKWSMLDLQARGFSVRMLHQIAKSLPEGESPSDAHTRLLGEWKFPFNSYDNGGCNVDVPVRYSTDSSSSGQRRVETWVTDYPITHPAFSNQMKAERVPSFTI